jgi:LysM repeat protein
MLHSGVFRKELFGRIQNNTHFYQRKIIIFIKERRSIKFLHLLRKYAALSVVISSALLVTATNMATGKTTGSLLFGQWNQSENRDPEKENKWLTSQLSKKNNLAFVPLIKANNAIDPSSKDDSEDLNFIQNNSVMVSANYPRKDPEEDGGVKVYEVQDGDTLSSIAVNNKITVNTILWANDITNADSIKPGDKIFILPVAGLQYTIKKGDTIDSIASKYKTGKDKIISFNDLPANGTVEEGQEIIIPDGQKEIPIPSTNNALIPRREYATPGGGTPSISGWKDLTGKAGTGHRFPYGYCTWYVAQKRYVPWGGNAGTWLYHARTSGYKTGKTPQVGAIVVTSESWWGHVAIVEKVSGGTITVSEMNYKGWAKSSRRVIATSSRVIKGYIY